VYRKLGASTRAGATLFAAEHGLLEPEAGSFPGFRRRTAASSVCHDVNRQEVVTVLKLAVSLGLARLTAAIASCT
jgi:hypothetical protein